MFLFWELGERVVVKKKSVVVSYYICKQSVIYI